MRSVYPRMESVSPQSRCLGFCVLPLSALSAAPIPSARSDRALFHRSSWYEGPSEVWSSSSRGDWLGILFSWCDPVMAVFPQCLRQTAFPRGILISHPVFRTKCNDECSSSMMKRAWSNWIYICLWSQTSCFSIMMQQAVCHFLLRDLGQASNSLTLDFFSHKMGSRKLLSRVVIKIKWVDES